MMDFVLFSEQWPSWKQNFYTRGCRWSRPLGLCHWKLLKVHTPRLTKFRPETPYKVKRSDAKNFQNRNSGFPTLLHLVTWCANFKIVFCWPAENFCLLLRWLFCCCSGGWTMVAYCRLQKRKEKTKNRLPNFSNIKAKHKNHWSNDSAKHTVSSKVTQRFFASNETWFCCIWRNCKASLHQFVSTVLCMMLWVRQSLECTLQFSSSNLIECPSRVFVWWMLESINIMEQIDEDNYLLTVQWRFVEGE